MIRLEINVPKSDKELLRKAAEKLRSGGPVAAQTRAALNAILNPFDSMPLKEMLESAPLEDLPLERSRETGKRIRL